MKYFVKFTCTGLKAEAMKEKTHPELTHFQEDMGKHMEYVEKSGKLKDGGSLLGGKGGYYVFDVEKHSELLRLIGKVIWENFDVEIYPIVSFKDMGEYMREEYKKAA